MKKIDTKVLCKQIQFNFGILCKHLQKYAKVEALPRQYIKSPDATVHCI